MSDPYQATTRDGTRIFVSPNDYLGRMIILFGEHERHNLSTLMRLMTPNGVFWDIGANYGVFSLSLARKFPLSNCVAVEPQPILADLVAKSAGINSITNISIVRAALSDKSGDLELTIPLGSFARASLTELAGGNKVMVPVRTLDDMLRDYPPPTLLKLDVEGVEENVIRGGERVFRTAGPDVLIEVNEARYQPLGELPAVKLLKKHGYNFWRADHRENIPLDLERRLGTHSHDVVAMKSK
ncbi:FkbM family methyltransferase [Mesorhizobium sp. M0684]|uniref:FkbM family methyltransferase n=1 Tax=Mesorhizobium sp. M0684 TaxID=2956986 RepID=UPI003336026C